MRRYQEEHRWRRRVSGPCTDAEERMRGERTGLDTLVVHAVNGGCWMWGPFHGFRVGANALSIPPGEYGRKAKTQRN